MWLSRSKYKDLKKAIDDLQDRVFKVEHPFKYQVGQYVLGHWYSLFEVGRDFEGVVTSRYIERQGLFRWNYYSVMNPIEKKTIEVSEAEIKEAKNITIIAE